MRLLALPRLPLPLPVDRTYLAHARIRQGPVDTLPIPLSPERSRPCSILLFVIASPCGSAAERRGTSAPGPRWIGRGLRGSGRELAVSHNTRALAPRGRQTLGSLGNAPGSDALAASMIGRMLPTSNPPISSL